MPHSTILDLFPGTCGTWNAVEPYVVIELHVSKPNITRYTPDHISSTSDPVNILDTGQEYRLALKPQGARCWGRSVDEIFGNKNGLTRKEIPERCQCYWLVSVKCCLELKSSDAHFYPHRTIQRTVALMGLNRSYFSCVTVSETTQHTGFDHETIR